MSKYSYFPKTRVNMQLRKKRKITCLFNNFLYLIKSGKSSFVNKLLKIQKRKKYLVVTLNDRNLL